MRGFNWSAWGLDWATWGWIAWIVFFGVWETVLLIVGTGQELTEHLRPVFLFAPPTWFMAVGLWLWLGVHLLWPPLESWIQSSVSGG